MNRSIAAISGVWLHRNVHQLLAGRSVAPVRHVLRDSGLSDLEAELQKLPMDARCAPERVLKAHLCDQCPQVPVDLGTPAPSCENPLGASARASPAERCEGPGGRMENQRYSWTKNKRSPLV